MTGGDGSPENASPESLEDLLGEGSGEANATTGPTTGAHGVVSGDDEVAFDLESCEIVAQSFDTEVSVGTRLYHVADDVFALSQYRRSGTQDWSEKLVTYGVLTVEPVELVADVLDEAVRERGLEPLTDSQLAHVRDVYTATCRATIWEEIEAPGTNTGPVVRGRIACVEDPAWRETLLPQLERLSDAQIDAVSDALVDARPEVDWTWCQLYAFYVARLDFAPTDDGADA